MPPPGKNRREARAVAKKPTKPKKAARTAKRPIAGRDPKTGHFLPGNRLWFTRSSAGPKPKFANPDDLWAACVEYFEWCHKNPLMESRLFQYEGKIISADLPKLRAMTITALCVFLDVSESSWHDWRNERADLLEVITRVEDIIRSQKFEGASAGLLDPRIIARDLGLADRREHTGKDGAPIQTEARTRVIIVPAKVDSPIEVRPIKRDGDDEGGVS